MCDGWVAHSLKPTVSDSILLNVNIACSCSDHMNHSKECAYKHEDDGRMFWILDSGAFTHFTPYCSDFIDYVELKGNDYIPVQTAGGIMLRFTFFFAFLISICPTLLANAFPSHGDHYSLPLLSRWSSWLRTSIFYSASFRRTASFLCSDNFRYLPRTIYLIELPPTFYHYIAWSVRSTP